MPTRAQIGTTLSRWLDKEGIKPPDLNERLGIDRKSTTIYTWLRGKGAPNDETRAKLAEVTGIAIERLTPNNGSDPAPEPPKQRPRETAVDLASPPRGVIAVTVQVRGPEQTHVGFMDPHSALRLLRLLLEKEEEAGLRRLTVLIE